MQSLQPLISLSRSALRGRAHLCLILTGALALGGCTQTYYIDRSDARPEGSPMVADVTVAYSACLDRCNQPGSLGSLTREGCLEGCLEARRQSGLVDRVFVSSQQCENTLWGLETKRDSLLARGEEWCSHNYGHIYKRQGCIDAFTVFYSHLTGPDVCGSRASAAPAPIEAVPVVVPPRDSLPPCEEAALLPLIPVQDTPAYEPVKIPSRPAVRPAPAPTPPPVRVPGGPDKDLPYPACIPADVPISRPAPLPAEVQPPVRISPEKDLPYTPAAPIAPPAPVIRVDPAPVTSVPPLPPSIPAPLPSEPVAAVVIEERTVLVETPPDSYNAPVSRAAPDELVIPALPPTGQVVPPELMISAP